MGVLSIKATTYAGESQLTYQLDCDN